VRVVQPDVLDRIRDIARGILEFSGMELVHLEMKREPGGWFVRLYIDKDGGVTLDDCSRVSRQLSTQLDLLDPIPERYTLEVSSPGLDRPLHADRDYERFAGRMVRLSATDPIDGRRHFVGRLLGLREGTVHLALEEGGEVAIPKERVAGARLEVEVDLPKRDAARGRHS
jgi:ribosome maturation factor RimP